MAKNPSCTNPASCDECDLAAAKTKTMGRSDRVKTNTILVGFVDKGGRTMGWETVRKEVKNFGRNENKTLCKNANYAKIIDCSYNRAAEDYGCHVKNCEAYTFHDVGGAGHMFWKYTETNWQWDAHTLPPCPKYHN